MRAFVATAPCRVDLVGGTLDVHPLPALLGEVVTVNAAITVLAEARVEARATGVELRPGDLGDDAVVAATAAGLPHDGPARLLAAAVRHAAPTLPLALATRSAAPPGSGLGGSSALVIAVLGALARRAGQAPDLAALPALASRIEAHVLQVPTGEQDHYPAVYGGVAALHFGIGPPRRVAYDDARDDLAAGLVVAYTGASHASGDLNWRVLRAVLDGDAVVRGRIERLRDIAAGGAAALARGDLAALGRALDADWAVRRDLAPGISTPECERLLAAAREAGALGARLCGAGGGGCLVALTAPERRQAVADALTMAKARVLPATVARTGLVVEEATE